MNEIVRETGALDHLQRIGSFCRTGAQMEIRSSIGGFAEMQHADVRLILKYIHQLQHVGGNQTDDAFLQHVANRGHLNQKSVVRIGSLENFVAGKENVFMLGLNVAT